MATLSFIVTKLLVQPASWLIRYSYWKSTDGELENVKVATIKTYKVTQNKNKFTLSDTIIVNKSMNNDNERKVDKNNLWWSDVRFN